MLGNKKSVLAKIGPSLLKLADRSQDIVWVRSPEWNEHLYVSPSFETIYGITVECLQENPGKWLEHVVVHDRDPLRQKISEFITDVKPESSFEAEYRINNFIDRTLWIKEFAMPVFEGDQLVCFFGIAVDVTDKKNHTKELQDASYFFKFFAEKIESVFWVRDKTGEKQLYLSPSYEKVWGRSLDSLYDDPDSWLQTLVPEDRLKNEMSQRLYEDNQDYKDKKYENRFRITRPDGEIRWIKDTNFPIFNEIDEFIGFAGIADDITNDVLRERELREAKEFAERANRSKSDFLAMMSHELRTPLNAVLGMAQILMGSELTEEQKDNVRVISQAGQSLLALLTDLLDFAKIEAGELKFKNEQVNLFDLVQRVIRNINPEAENKSLALKLQYTLAKNVTILCDPKRLEQVLLNLLSNAVKFTDEGHVMLTVSSVHRTQSEQAVCFTVEDTGIGIERSKLQSIFGRFQQIDSVYQRKHDGVGLGLAIVKELVDKMSGSIMVSSEVGVGSQFSCILTFRISLETRLSDTLTATDPLGKYSNKTIPDRYDLKILVVEDNVINQKISQIMLEQLGCEVDIADCSAKAISMFANGYDLIFMDLGLPDQDGFQTVIEIRKLEQGKIHTPIVAMTAHVFQQDKDRCFEVGMNEVISKPIVQQDLIDVLHKFS